MPEDMPYRMPDRMPEDMSDRMHQICQIECQKICQIECQIECQKICQIECHKKMPEDMPYRMPDRMPEDMSDRMPEDLPVRKSINVMVGITRSKVIFSLSLSLIIGLIPMVSQFNWLTPTGMIIFLNHLIIFPISQNFQVCPTIQQISFQQSFYHNVFHYSPILFLLYSQVFTLSP